MHLVRVGLAKEEARQLLEIAESVNDQHRKGNDAVSVAPQTVPETEANTTTPKSALPTLMQRLQLQQQKPPQQQTNQARIQQLAAEDRLLRRDVFLTAAVASAKTDSTDKSGRARATSRKGPTQFTTTAAPGSRLSRMLDWRELFRYRTPSDVELGVGKNVVMGAFGGLKEDVGVPTASSRENDIAKRTIAKDDSLILVRAGGKDEPHRTSTSTTPTDPPSLYAASSGHSVEYIWFGEAVKTTLYSLSLAGTFANAGSYGATPRGVVRAVEMLEVMEQQHPARFDIEARWNLLDEVTERLARFLRCDPGDLLLLPNCNTATSTALKSLPWEPRDRILILSCEYDATIAAVEWLVAQYGVVIEMLEVTFPVSDDKIISDLRGRLLALHIGGRLPRLANFCHVTSKSAWIFPIKRMVAVCHEFGVPVLVDGAHAPGHVATLDLNDIGADLYCGTCHKWMYSCQGVAFIVVRPEWHALMDPLVPTGYTTQYLTQQQAAHQPQHQQSIEAHNPLVQGASSSDDAWEGRGSAKLGPKSALNSASLAFRFRMSIAPTQIPTFIALWTAMDFAEYICGGWDRIFSYQQRLAEEAAVYLHKEWELVKDGIYDPCIQWCQMGATGQLVVSRDDLGSDKGTEATLRQRRQRAQSMKSAATDGTGDDVTSLMLNAQNHHVGQISEGVGNCMPLIPIPNSRNATDKDAKTLMGYLLTRFNITCFIAVAPVIAYTDDAATRFANARALSQDTRSDVDATDLGVAAAHLREFDWARGPVKMLVLRFTAQVHASHQDTRTIGAAVRAVQMSSSLAAEKLLRRDMANSSLQGSGEAPVTAAMN
ncbi:aminotransferase, putative [Bodo saltans]|uniref:Aminotransferase, putative n=1 Tax=Bodo saltans TaxID=75058 RepID=A0A0S4II04_BODSA|nr:aminotransferase, putative [Bodo saltans]|eukprot:CUE70284.1 aminotransferase, putative [Bodo saltans]